MHVDIRVGAARRRAHPDTLRGKQDTFQLYWKGPRPFLTILVALAR